MSKTIRIKNELPKLLAAVCNHPDCPDWLKGEIWDTMNDQSDSSAYSIHYLRFLFEASKDSKDCEHRDREIKPNQPHQNCNQPNDDILNAELIEYKPLKLVPKINE